MEYLKCAKCLKLVSSPVYVCHSGDILCAECRQLSIVGRSTSYFCPVCRQPCISVSSFSNFLTNFKMNCSGSKNGCQERLTLGHVTDHERVCYFLKTNICYLAECKKQIYSCTYKDHCTSHEGLTRYNLKRLKINVNVNDWKELRHSLIVEDDHHNCFELNIRVTRSVLKIALRHLGEKKATPFFIITISAVGEGNETIGLFTTLPFAYDVNEVELWKFNNLIITKSVAQCKFENGFIKFAINRLGLEDSSSGETQDMKEESVDVFRDFV